MAITFGFFNSANGDRKYNADDIGRYLQGLVSSGVYSDSSSSLQVYAAGGLTVQVQPGRAMLDYHYMENDAPYPLTLANGGTQDRIDAIVMRLNMTQRLCEFAVVQGTPASAPKAPAMTRTDVIKEYMLASVYVTKLATAITQSSITDTRPDTSVCGWVTGIITQVDTETLFKQWQTAYEEAYAETEDYLAAQKAAWESFFEDIKNNNALPAPATADAGKIPVVNEDANGYVLQEHMTDAEVIAYADSRCPVNLLDNSDFTNAVNQRGATTYSGKTQYTIDRWKATSSKLSVTLEDDCIKVTCDTSATARNGFTQWLPEEKTPASGEWVTVAYMDHEDTIHMHSTTMAAAGYQSTFFGFINLFPAGSPARLAIMVDPGWTLRFKWIALYRGQYTEETLPEYKPKGYAAELMECMRYYQNLGNVQTPGHAYASAKSVLVSPPTKVPMRAFPSLAIESIDWIRGSEKSITTLPSYAVTTYGNNIASPTYSLDFAEALTVTNLHACMVYMDCGLSADL